MHVDQANLVFEAKGIDPSRYRFEVANIFEYHAEAEYDVVLCLGLMYHISKPVELFELMTRAGADVIVIDTRVSTAPGVSSKSIMRHSTILATLWTTNSSWFRPPRRSSTSELSSGSVPCRFTSRQ